MLQLCHWSTFFSTSVFISAGHCQLWSLLFLMPFHHYSNIVLDSSNYLDQKPISSYICLYPSCWDLPGITENRAIGREYFGIIFIFVVTIYIFSEFIFIINRRANEAVSGAWFWVFFLLVKTASERSFFPHLTDHIAASRRT